MRIAFLGNFNVDYSSESHYKKTFQRLGHEIYCIQEGQPLQFSDRFLEVDMFFWVHTHGWVTPGLDDLLTQVQQKNIPIVGYHLDLWKGLRREKDLETDPYWKWVSHFFTCDKLFVPDLEARGIKAYYLPAGVFEDECYLGTKRPELEHDVIFAGSYEYHPEWPYRPQLIDWLKQTYGDRFAHYGRDGKALMRGKDLNDLYASAKVVVGDTLCKDFSYPYYFSDRLFETPGRGGFMIFPWIEGLDDLFETQGVTYHNTPYKPELAAYKFGDFEGLKGRIDYYIANSKEREAIRLAGHERVKSEHTYTHRLRNLLNIISNKNGN